MTHMPPTLTTRDGLREAIKFDLDEAFEAVLQPVTLDDGDVWNGIRVVTKKDLDAALATVFGVALPPPSETVVEVATPATVEVTARCPRCGIPTRIEMEITEELRVSTKASSIHLSGKAKAKTHVCGQLNLPEAKDAPVDSQEAFALEDVVTEEQEAGVDVITDASGDELERGEPDALVATGPNGSTRSRRRRTQAVPDIMAEICPYGGCVLPVEHEGPHYDPSADSDLLPA